MASIHQPGHYVGAGNVSWLGKFTIADYSVSLQASEG